MTADLLSYFIPKSCNVVHKGYSFSYSNNRQNKLHCKCNNRLRCKQCHGCEYGTLFRHLGHSASWIAIILYVSRIQPNVLLRNNNGAENLVFYLSILVENKQKIVIMALN